MTSLWTALLIAACGCYVLKLCGLSLPQWLLDQPTVQRVARLLPVAMLSALVATQLFGRGTHYAADWRVLAGMAAAVVALLLRRGLLVVFVAAVTVTALLRLIS